MTIASTQPLQTEPLLKVEHLSVQLPTPRGTVHAVRDAGFYILPGEMLALVGESGCGKSVSAQALMALLPVSARIQANCMQFAGTSLLDPAVRTRLRGTQISMVFQNPMATFNPTLSIGYQIAEPLRVHRGFNRHDAEAETIRLLERMQIRSARERVHLYPHAFSGGMLQRAAIAMALAAEPQLLIADEPTTALDVSTQGEILALLSELRAERQLAVLLITHDLRLVAEHAQRVSVMYAGETVESAITTDLLAHPQHPYTQALLAALPQSTAHAQHQRLQDIPGSPPDLRLPINGCAFAPRCPYSMQICAKQSASVFTEINQTRCWQQHPDFHSPTQHNTDRP